MGALPKTRMKADDYLRWSATQDQTRHELVDGNIVMMSPETVRHVEVKAEVWLALRNAIATAGVACRAFGDGAGIRIDEFTVREPDATVQCKPADPDSMLLDEPLIVMEVVSPSTARSDTGAKVAEYFRVASIRHYLIVDPFNRVVIRHSRGEADGAIGTEIHSAGPISLNPPGIVIETADLLGPDTNASNEGTA